MANIFDKVKGLFAKEETAGEALRREIDEAQARLDKMNKKYASRRDQILECNLVMQDCRKVFNETILTERDLAAKKKRQGIPTDRERTRMHEAAIGILVTEMALMDLESIKSESDLNSAMNTMGKALKQLIRMDNSTENISRSSRNFIDMFYPGFKGMVEGTENYTTVNNATRKDRQAENAEDIASIYEIPANVRARIDDTFVENLMRGDSYKMAMFKAVNGNEDPQTAHHISDDDIPSSGPSSSAIARANAILSGAARESDDDIDNESYKMTSR